MVSWCHGGLSRTISMVPDPPFFCNGACRFMEHHFLAITEGSSWKAFPHGFKTSCPLVFDAKNDLPLAGDAYPEFSLSC